MEENVNPITTGVGSVLKRAFVWMFLGLLATAIIAVYTYKSDLLLELAKTGGFQILAIVEVVVVIVFSLISRKLPAAVVAVLYFLYAVLNGVTMSMIFYVFDLGSIFIAFIGAAILFGIFAFIGYVIKADLTKFGVLFLGTLVAGVIISIINIFINSTLLDIIISWAMLLIFFGITAFDIQKIKRYYVPDDNTGVNDKLHIYAAMDLYLDFINIFLRLLRLFGKRK